MPPEPYTRSVAVEPGPRQLRRRGAGRRALHRSARRRRRRRSSTRLNRSRLGARGLRRSWRGPGSAATLRVRNRPRIQKQRNKENVVSGFSRT